jgi:outer membrane protein OmpA-like peptidoglycan-associated protein
MLKQFLIFTILITSSTIYSQSYLGVVTSNYSGVSGTDLQPASFVDGRFKFDINLFSVNFNTYQNFGYFDANAMRSSQGGKGHWWIKSFSDIDIFNSWAKPDSTFNDRFFIRNYDANSSGSIGLNSNLQIDLLNFMFHINPKIAVGFTSKFRSITNIDNVDPQLAILVGKELNYPNLWNVNLDEELLNLNHLTWAEYGINYSQVISDEKKHFFKIGGKIKYLAGFSSAYLQTSNFSFDLLNADFTQSLNGDFAYGYSSNLDDITSGNNSGLPKSQSKFGLGLDLGMVYEWRPDWDKYKYDMDGETNLWARHRNKYKARAGLSVLDIGGMRFQKGGLSKDFSVNSNNLFEIGQFFSVSSFSDFDKIVDSMINASNLSGNNNWSVNPTSSDEFFMRTPTAMSIQLDYHIWKWFYVNATGIFNILSPEKALKVRIPNQFSITPSFDFPWFGIHIPISINSYSGFKMGAATRLGPLSLGVTDFRTLLARGQVRGAEIFMGVRLPLLYDAIDDIDKDKVSDKLDDCITTPGLWSFKGCPDSDGDGIKDMDDDCASVFGLAEFKGCPDKDGDKIPDKDDDCPEIAGLREFKGCPDKDGDKIIDKNDDCPDIAGLVEFKGCPDKDGDKTPDKDDYCPDIPGLIEMKGCPDSDGDGLSDIEDTCPEVSGLKENQGCPDTDGDGLHDRIDACPESSGPLENQGCPDKDGDGLFDFIDDCPDIAGPKENQGCPWPDSDGDGILDKNDECETIKGPKENKGCPYKDTDGDGLLDKDDDCPVTPGPKENKGCPVIEKQIEEILKTAFENLEFETAEDIIIDISKPALDELAQVLVKKSTWKLDITGHTDNVGDDNANMVLSKKRAEALKKYLISKGINGERMNVFYFGETQPISDNATPEGRRKNRRVEMKIVFE